MAPDNFNKLLAAIQRDFATLLSFGLESIEQLVGRAPRFVQRKPVTHPGSQVTDVREPGVSQYQCALFDQSN